jgi:hypothetical protein
VLRRDHAGHGQLCTPSCNRSKSAHVALANETQHTCKQFTACYARIGRGRTTTGSAYSARPAGPITAARMCKRALQPAIFRTHTHCQHCGLLLGAPTAVEQTLAYMFKITCCKSCMSLTESEGLGYIVALGFCAKPFAGSQYQGCEPRCPRCWSPHAGTACDAVVTAEQLCPKTQLIKTACIIVYIALA